MDAESQSLFSTFLGISNVTWRIVAASGVTVMPTLTHTQSWSEVKAREVVEQWCVDAATVRHAHTSAWCMCNEVTRLQGHRCTADGGNDAGNDVWK